MEQITLRNTIYTVTDKRRGPHNDRTAYTLTGPRDGKYLYVELDNGKRRLTLLGINPKTVEWREETHLQRLEREEAAEVANAAARIDANTAELTAAVEQWLNVNREDVRAVSNAASELCRISRNLSAYAGDIAQVASRKAWRHA